MLLFFRSLTLRPEYDFHPLNGSLHGMSSLSTCLHSECLENICGKKRREKILSAVLLLLLDPSLEKKEGRKQRNTLGFAWKNAVLVGAARRSRMQIPWYFIHQLIYGLHTALNNPVLSLRAWALGSIKVRLKQRAETSRGRCAGETSSIQFINILIVLNVSCLTWKIYPV